MAARSFCATVTATDGLLRPLAALRSEVPSPSGGLVFVAGALAQEAPRVAELVRSMWKGVPACVVPGAGVLTERGEVEGTSAASGILWSGGAARSIGLGDAGGQDALRELLASEVGARAATVLLFPRSDFSTEALARADGAAPVAWVFGAGTVGGPAVGVSSAGEMTRGRASGLVVTGLSAPLVEAPVACRLLMPLLPIAEVSGGLVLRLGAQTALDALSSCMPTASGSGGQGAQQVVFAALAEGEGAREGEEGEGEEDEEAPVPFVVRPVRGVDPTRGGVMIGAEARPGMRMAFAVREAAAARAGLEAAARRVAHHALGAAPRFAIYLSCAGRGQGLYGAPDVEARILRQRFGDLPIAGMHSSFEIAPAGPGRARLALYTGVLALFRSPS
jgi:small ligand-binding sensory domain FIST